MLNILFLGDVVGKIGRRALAQALPGLRQQHGADLVIVNGENSAHGNGITASTYAELRAAGADVITLGDHAFDRQEAGLLLDTESAHLVRPANYPPHLPGVGATIAPVGTREILVVNLLGRVFMKHHYDDPFRAIDAILAQYQSRKFAAVVIDFHAEATSEKMAFAWHVDGRVAAVVGTHTHVPTADTRLLPGGTAAVSDLGMVGARDSVIGVQRAASLKLFRNATSELLEPVESGACVIGAVLVTVDPGTGRARDIQRVDTVVEV